MKWNAALALALLMTALPVTGEQVQATVFDDGPSDVMIESQDGTISQADPTGNYDNVDVRVGGVWAEDDDSITFFLEFESLTEASQTPAPFSDPDYHLYFRYGEQGYRIMIATSLDNPVNQAFGRGEAFSRLEQQVNEFQYRGLADASTEMQYGDNRVLVTIPRGAIVDHNTAPLARNATLNDIYVESSSMGWFGFPIGFQQGQATFVGIPRAFDRGPDEQGVGTYTMQTGTVQQRGKLFAVTNDPVRWTNGEATTLKFETRVTNLASEELDVSVEVTGTPSSWAVAYADKITIPARDAVNVTVLASIPFGHAHGETELFEVGFSSLNGDHEATSVLGVHWPFVPQPAGHHDKLWLHSFQQTVQPPFDTVFTGTHAWFSAAENLDEDEQVPIPPAFTQMPGFFGAQEGAAYWFMSLEPDLRMGLDFEPTKTGLMEVAFNLPIPVVDPRVEVSLMQQVQTQGNNRLGGNDDGVRFDRVLVEGASEPGSGPVSGAFSNEVELHVASGIDDVPYDPATNIGIIISLKGTFLFGPGFVNPETVVPTLDASTSFTLPLNEYHDPTDLTFNTDASVTINVGEQGQERFVNAGRTVVYEFDLDYSGLDAANFRAELTGKNVAWASIIGDLEFQLAPGEARPLAIAVTAPEGARDSEQSDVTLTITSKQNAAIQAGIRVLTTVTSSEDIPDESHQAEELSGELTNNKGSPGLPLIGLLAAIGIALKRRQ